VFTADEKCHMEYPSLLQKKNGNIGHNDIIIFTCRLNDISMLIKRRFVHTIPQSSAYLQPLIILIANLRLINILMSFKRHVKIMISL
jgi:hypothetical protein